MRTSGEKLVHARAQVGHVHIPCINESAVTGPVTRISQPGNLAVNSEIKGIDPPLPLASGSVP